MATEKLTIVVNQKGAKVTAAAVRAVGKSAKESQPEVSGLKSKVLLVNQALEIMGKVMRAVKGTFTALAGSMDVFTNMQNRLKLVTFGTQNLATVTRDLEAVATETRQSFSATADVYSRVALSVKALGGTQHQTMKFVENLNKAIVLSGASAVEASAGMIQLSQGLASNRLSGDELRSVLEQLPKVADLIAKHMGVTRGALRKLGEEGKLQAQDVFDSIRLADDQVKEFDNTQATFAQTVTQVKNEFVLWIGKLDKAYGITKALTSAMRTLADIFFAVVNGVLALGKKFADLIRNSRLLSAIVDGLIERLRMLFKVIGALVKIQEGFMEVMFVLADGLLSVADTLFGFEEATESTGNAMLDTLPAWGQQVYFAAQMSKELEKVIDADNRYTDLLKEKADKTVAVTNAMNAHAVAIKAIRDAGVETKVDSPTAGISDSDIADKLSLTRPGGLAEQNLIEIITTQYSKLTKVTSEQVTVDAEQEKRLKAVIKQLERKRKISEAVTEEAKAALQVRFRLLDGLKKESGELKNNEAWTISNAEAEKVKEVQDKKKLTTANKFLKVLKQQTRARELLRAVTEEEKLLVKVKHKMVDALGQESTAWGVFAQAMFYASVEIAKQQKLEADKKRNASSRASTIKGLRAQLEGLRRSTDSVTEAEGRLADVEKLLAKAIKFKLINQEDALALGTRIKDNMAEQLNPFQALINQLKAEGDAIDEGTDAKRRRIKVEEALSKFKGTRFDESPERAIITDLVLDLDDYTEAVKASKAALTEQTDTLDKVILKQRNNRQSVMDTIATGQEELRLAHEQVEIRKLLADGLEGEAWKQLLLNDAKAKNVKLSREMLDLIDEIAGKKQLQADADAIEKLANAATIQGEIIKQAFSGMADVIADFVAEGDFSFENFKESFNQLVESLLRDMTRMLIMRAFFAGLGGGDAAANILGTTPPGIGAATGGSFIVPGSGGPDSQVTMLRTTPGERVSVETNSQQKKNDAPQGGGGPAQVFVLNDPRQFDAAFATASFDRHVVRVMADNPSIMRRFNRTR